MGAGVSQADTDEVALQYNVTGTRIIAAPIDMVVITAATPSLQAAGSLPGMPL